MSPGYSSSILKIPRLPGILFSVLLAILLAGTHSRYYIAYSFAATFVVWSATRPPKIRYLWVAALVVILWGARLVYSEPSPGLADSIPQQIFYMTAAFLGAGSLIVLSIFPLYSQGEAGLIEMLAAFATPAFGLFADRWFRYMTSHPLLSLDRILFAFDHNLGFQAGFFIGRMFVSWPIIALPSVTVYRMLPVTMTLVFVSLPARPVRLRLSYIAATAIAGFVGYLSYRACPAAGPGYAFPAMFPLRIPEIAANWIHPVAMPSSLLNAFPSLHTTWALLVLAWSEHIKIKMRLVVVLLVALTLLATLGLGEHYAMDLVVAVPFAATIEALFTMQSFNMRRHLLSAALCSAIFVAWVLAVRSGAVLQLSPAVARALALATVLLPLLLRRTRRRYASL